MTVTRAVTNHFVTSWAEIARLQHAKHVTKLGGLRSRTALKHVVNLRQRMHGHGTKNDRLVEKVISARKNNDFRTAPWVASDA